MKRRTRGIAALLCALVLAFGMTQRAEAAVAWGSRGEQVSKVQ